MNRFLLAVIGVISISGLAGAAQIEGVMLELKYQPVAQIMGGTTTVIQLNSEGLVTSESCRAVPNPCTKTTLAQLDAAQIAKISDLIDEAKDGKKVTPDARFQCKAMAYLTKTYSADNSEVFLESVALPCGFPTVNDSESARELVKFLDLWDKQAQNATTK